MKKQLNVLELFAGVGGFRVGLEKADKELFVTKWANQWEPARKSQDAFEVYDYHFRDSVNINKSIMEITDKEFSAMDADIIVGGFPCQDYSVARGKSGEKGIEGKKGVLFWEIIRAVKNINPQYLILENVDRLLKSPANQRGRDFSIMLQQFNELGYDVEWRVINAADYGCAQRRRRVFIFVFKNDSEYAKKVDINLSENYLFDNGLFARAFPIEKEIVKDRINKITLPKDLVEISDSYSTNYWNSGIMKDGKVLTIETLPKKEKFIPLKDVLVDDDLVDDKYYINDTEKLAKFKYLRGAKKIERISKTGHKYIYSEGGMSEYEDLELPSRTMLTSEGGMSRSTHLIYRNNKYRLLTPIEAERLQSFDDDWTKYKLSDGVVTKVSDKMRMFFMGNALVTKIVERIGKELKNIIY